MGNLRTIFILTSSFKYLLVIQSLYSAAASIALVVGIKTPGITNKDFLQIIKQNLKIPRKYAAILLIDYTTANQCNILPRITIPILVIGGSASLFLILGIKWIISQIPGAKLRIFSKSKASSYFLFWENTSGFNTTIYNYSY